MSNQTHNCSDCKVCLHAVSFPKNRFTQETAANWLLNNGIPYDQLAENNKYYHAIVEKGKFTTLKQLECSKSDAILVLGFH